MLYRVALISMAIIVLLPLGGCAPAFPEAAKAPGVPGGHEGFRLTGRASSVSAGPRTHTRATAPSGGMSRETWRTGQAQVQTIRSRCFASRSPPEQPDLNACIGASHVWMAHLALTDIGAKTLSSGAVTEALGLAGAQSDL